MRRLCMAPLLLCCAMVFVNLSVAPDHSLADDVSSAVSNCDEIFEGDRASKSFIQALADLAIPLNYNSDAAKYLEPPSQSSKITKWAKAPRLVLKLDGPITFPAGEVIGSFIDEAAALGLVDKQLVIDKGELGEGDIFVLLSSNLRAFDRDRSPVLWRRLVDFYGSDDELARSIKRHQSARDAGFVDVIGDSQGNAVRALVAIDAIGPKEIRQPQLFELLTSAINPNPGAQIHEDWVYAKVWSTQIYYTLK